MKPTASLVIKLSGPTCIKQDKLDPWIKDQLKINLLFIIFFPNNYKILYDAGGFIHPACHKISWLYVQNHGQQSFSCLIPNPWSLSILIKVGSNETKSIG